MYKILLILFLLITHGLSFDIKKFNDELLQITAQPVYNLDNYELLRVVKPLLLKHENIKAMIIKESLDDQVLFRFYRDKEKLVFDKNIPNNFPKFLTSKRDINFNSDIIGSIFISYENEKNNKIDLTKEEKKWIDTNIVKIGVEQWSPIVFSNNGKDIDGICGDFTKKIIERTGLKVKIINDNWNKLLTDFKYKKLDILPATYYTKKRAEFGLYGDEYFKMKNSIYFKATTLGISSLKDLEGKTLAIPKGYGTIENIEEEFPKIKLVFTKDLDDSINRVLNGKVTAFYEGQIAAQAKIDEELIKGLKYISVTEFKAPSLYYFSKIDEPILQSIIQKGLKSITYQEKTTIISKWLNLHKDVILTLEENKWLEKKINIKYAFDPSWKPLEWADSIQEHKGIISDIIKLIKQKSGISIMPIYSTSWDDVVNKVKTSKADMFLSGELSDNKHLNFTKNKILTSPYVFISKVSDDYLDGFDSLKNKKFGVFKNSSIHNILKKEKPNLKFILFTSDEEALEMIKNSELDVVILSANIAKYYIGTLGYKESLKISYKTKYNLELKFALNKSIGAIPLSIIDKSLKSIGEKELSDIVYKWTEIKVQKQTDWILIGQISGAVFLIFIFILFNNRKLKSMVEKKTIELRDLLDSLEMKVEERTVDLTTTKKEIEIIHKHTKESIEYASLIQGALIPTKGIMSSYFKDHFVTWTPKDIVGGDIWLFNELRHEDECLLMFIDCTGHGVPGAFVTMIVKSVEREIISKIKADRYNDIDVSPSWVMAYFNKTMKTLLRQETKDSLSNAGWDGGIIYYNKRTQILKFAGAETSLFYIDENKEFKTIKGNRYSVGYKKCAMNYEYKEIIIDVKEGMKFYCTTDGYLDQNGGEKDFPFGKKRFGNIIKENHTESMAKLQNILVMEMMDWESAIENNDRNDDMTVIAFEIGKQSNFKEDKIIEIVKYEGVMTQNVIASCMDNIEAKITNMAPMGVVSTITIEYCQNMMNYSKNDDIGSRQIVPAGTIEVQYHSNEEDEYYEIIAKNIVSIEDKKKIEPKLIEIQSLDKVGIKKRYRELRKSGQNTHSKGGGIGLYEIAKVSDSIEYSFTAINEDKHTFTMKSFVKLKTREKKEI